MILFCLLEVFTLFAGVTIWFLITQKGNAVVTTNFASVFKTLIQDTPPMPSVDAVMWLRIGLLMFLAWVLHEDFEKHHCLKKPYQTSCDDVPNDFLGACSKKLL